MKVFDLEKALAGEKVITRDGSKVTQLVSFAVKVNDFTVYAVIEDEVDSWTKTGGYCSNGSDTHPNDLFMAIELIDGKAYQFGYKGLSRLHGIYCMKTDTLCFHSGHPNVSDCTDIKPLTVEVS